MSALEEKRHNNELGDSDAFKSMIEICNENGFRASQHQVVTEDGYILNIWRIDGKLVPGSDDVEKNASKKPLLL